MFEPRGHADMYGCILLPQMMMKEILVLFLHNEGYSTMCGHAIIAISTLAIHEMDRGCRRREYIENRCPCGRIVSYTEVKTMK